jgi:hypothetical protein
VEGEEDSQKAGEVREAGERERETDRERERERGKETKYEECYCVVPMSGG